MPNWCNNNVTFEHSDPAEIKRLESAFNRGELMQEFDPCPQPLREAVADFTVNEKLVAEYGASNWYDWQVGHWGTKWDVGEEGGIRELDSNSISVYFDSAWSPPTDFYDTMQEKGWKIKAFYYEPGMSFCGIWDDGDDAVYEITGDSKWVVENIPEELDEMFQISADMEMWEQEQAEETETETDNEENK